MTRTLVTPCSIEGCEELHNARGWCKRHYDGWRAHGDPLALTRPGRRERPVCSVEGCEEPHNAYGWCAKHYYRWRRHGDPLVTTRTSPGERPVCSVEGCDRPHKARGWCKQHYGRWLERGGDPTTGGPVTERTGSQRFAYVGYSRAHQWVYRDRGKASVQVCAHCGEQAQDWAYDHEDPNEVTGLWGGRVLTYSLDTAHYLPLCRACHRTFDTPSLVGSTGDPPGDRREGQGLNHYASPGPLRHPTRPAKEGTR